MIVAHYAPVRGDNGRTRDEFCEKMCNVMNKCNPGEKIILLGNTNEWVQIMQENTGKNDWAFQRPKKEMRMVAIL